MNALTSRVERFYTSFAAFILGAICCGVTFALFGGLTEFEGHAADWLAAAGTWVIGWGAWKYARDGHLHQLATARRIERDRLHRRIVLATSAIEKLLGMVAFGTSVCRMASLDGRELQISARYFTITSSVEASVELTADERECFDAHQLHDYAHLMRLCTSVRSTLLVNGPHFGGVTSLFELPVDRIKLLAQGECDLADEIIDRGGTIASALSTHRTELETLRDALDEDVRAFVS